MRFVMAFLGFFIANFVFSRVHIRTRLGLMGATVVTVLVLVFFSYFSTYYTPPEGMEEAVALERVAEMNVRRLFLVAGEVAGMGAYFFRVYRAGNKLKA